MPEYFSSQVPFHGVGPNMDMTQVVLIPGDGIGPEIANAVRAIFEGAQAPIEFIEAEAGLGCVEKFGTGCPQETLDLIAEKGIAIKGPTATPIGGGHKSVNVTIRKALDLYANVRPIRTLPGVETRYPGIDLIIVRENIEDTYGGIEHMQSADVAQCLRLITRPGCLKIAHHAFRMMRTHQRKRLVCVQKANIMKLTDGLFLDVFREVAKEYPDVETQEMLVDNCCMQLVTKPQQFDVLLLPNLFGDIVSDLAAGLVGGLGIAPGGNIGDHCAVFEAVHGTAPDIAGKGMANPTALLQSSIAMLRHLGLLGHADRIQRGLVAALQSGVRTRDLGGKAGTQDFTEAVVREIQAIPLPEVEERAVVPRGSASDGAAAASPKPVRKVLGFDIFVQHDGIPAMHPTVGPFKLTMISNRGTKVFPGKAPDILLIDVHRCRYEVAAAGATVTDLDVSDAIRELEGAFTWVHIEKLHSFNGKLGFGLAQGQSA